MAGGKEARMLDQTATWSVAIVCAVIVIISVLLEHILHTVGHFLKKRHKPGLLEALEKIKNELMVLGFISLLLVFSQTYIASICISKQLTKDFLPCKKEDYFGPEDNIDDEDAPDKRRLLFVERRKLAGGAPVECKEGYEEIISVAGLHQLHIFIFFLAVFHVIYSAFTMVCGSIKTRKWKYWEREIMQEHVTKSESTKYKLAKELSFVKHHTGAFTQTPLMFYIVCFFRQFFMSVRRSDYLAMRHAFFSVHLSPGSHFNFQKYIKKSLQDDFKVIVGISPLLWANAVLYLFANVDGAKAMTYLSLFPVMIILAVGTKLQAIVTQLAVEIQERQKVTQGIPVIELSDRHFWFNQPRLILYLIQLTLFQNSFEITHFIWIWVIAFNHYKTRLFISSRGLLGNDLSTRDPSLLSSGICWYEFGLDTCFYEAPVLQYGRVIIGIFVQGLCSYSILPLYALVTQMGSTMKRSIFDDQTSKVLKSWHENAKKKDKSTHGKTKTLGHPTEPEGGTQGKGSSSDIASTSVSSRQSANIVASVDIPEDKTPHT